MRAQTVSTVSRRTAEVAIYRGGSAFQGIIPAVLGNVPNGLLSCFGYELWREVLQERVPTLPFRARDVISAILGDLTGHIWLTPMELLKVRLQSGRNLDFSSAISEASKSGVAGFYRGYSAQISRDVPFRALQLYFFEEMRRMWAARKPSKRLTAQESLLVGAAAGSAARLITIPADVARSRMMMQGGNAGLSAALRQVVREGGGALTASVAPAIVFMTANTCLFMAVFDLARKGPLARPAKVPQREGKATRSK